MAEVEYPWDLARESLIALTADPWAEPLGKISPRQEAASFFAMRVLARIQALEALFSPGSYADAYAVVRAAYEDWLTAAYVFRLPGDERWLRFRTEVNRIDARVFEAFARFCGEEAANERFKNVPESVKSHLGRSNRQARRDGWPGFGSIADDVGLRLVHDYVYTRLSILMQAPERRSCATC